MRARYYTISKFRVAAVGNGISVGRNGRIIGNDVIGTTIFLAGIGIIQTGSDGVKIYANTTHGAMYHTNGHAKFFNNTLINSRGKGIQVTGGLSLTTEIKNNVFITDDYTYLSIYRHYYYFSSCCFFVGKHFLDGTSGLRKYRCRYGYS